MPFLHEDIVFMLPAFTMSDFFLYMFMYVHSSCDVLLLMGAALRRPCLRLLCCYNL